MPFHNGRKESKTNLVLAILFNSVCMVLEMFHLYTVRIAQSCLLSQHDSTAAIISPFQQTNFFFFFFLLGTVDNARASTNITEQDG